MTIPDDRPADEARDERPTGFADLLDLLNFEDDERLSICSQKPDGPFEHTAPLDRANAVGVATSPLYVDHRCVWFSVNPVAVPPGYLGRGTDEHVTRVAALFADVDHKAGGVTDADTANTVTKAISAALGQFPAAVVFSGNGGHPYWVTDPEDDAWTLDTEDKRAAAAALYRRFHRLCAHLAGTHGGSVDNVGQLSRILRVPGTFNRKDAANPVAVRLEVYPYGPGGPLTFAEVAEALDAYDVPEEPEDRVLLGAVVSAPEGWEFGTATTPYVQAMISRWSTDVPPQGRHPWLVGQAVRLACAHRLGRITEADHERAVTTLAGRFEELIGTGPDKRAPTPGEVAGTLAWGVLKAASMSDARAAKEVGGEEMSFGDPSMNGAASSSGAAGLDPLEAQIAGRQQWLWVDREAKARLAHHDAALIEIPPPMSLTALLAEDDPPVRHRIAQVWPAGGARIMLAAPEKAGKTTLLGNLVRSLADGDPFLGAFAVEAGEQARMVLIDNEMSRDMTRRWLREQGIGNPGALLDVQTLRGRAGLFDLGNDRIRGRWARQLSDQGCNFLIFDCLRPVLDALGLKESTEAGMFLEPFDQLLIEAGIPDALIAHHMGHSSERARGDSRIVGWSDGNWKIVRLDEGPNAPKFFTAMARDGEPVPEGELRFDPLTRRLTYMGGVDRSQSRQNDAVDKKMHEVLTVLAERLADSKDSEEVKDSMNTTEIRQAVGGKKELTTQALAQAVGRKPSPLLTRITDGRAVRYRITPEGLDPFTF
ncbi:AAA family ATPase [Nocardia sp. 348MFTsu5.1]|uniref:AAA family ATPase n=1 Tax=Nocardia sp. 348MFTsu5.1 TaxID=1172185 RepID=UPI00037700AD|nr:AAA family ATPase [Nocardia sp. 348MFTsu5.1]